MSQALSKDDKGTSAPTGFFAAFGRVFLGAEADSKGAIPKIIDKFAGLKGPVHDRDIAFMKGIESMTNLRLDKPEHPDIFKLLHKTNPVAPLGEQFDSTTTHRFPYARIILPEASSPDDSVRRLGPAAEKVFDRLLSRQDSKRTDHSQGVSGLAYALAQVLQLSLSRPSRDYPSYNETSPYLDLSPLYGTNDEEEKQVREIDGRGMLKPDCFFETRTRFLSPATCVLLILLNRNHNYVAHRLLSNNEKSRWSDPSQLQESDLKTKQDNSIFEIARSINCAQFKNIIQEDFLKGLMGLHNVGPSPNIDCAGDLRGRKDKPKNDYKSIVEFSQLYHFPALMHEKDEDWLGQQLKDSAPDADLKVCTDSDQCPTYHIKDGETVPLVRSEGRFNDDDLAHILLSATEAIAGAPGARHTPTVMRNLDIAIMNQARSWNVCTMNDFRSYLGLKRFDSFKEWNHDDNISAAADDLYGDIKNLELFPGLQAEDNMPGSGFCLGYTQTYGLFVAIITSIRNDPRFTVDMNPECLTEWGFNACNPSPRRDNGAYGAMLSNLILRNLHRSYGYNNIYGLFPLTVPATTKERLLKLNARAPSLYDMERPTLKLPHILTKYDDISSVLNAPEVFATTYGRDLELLTNGYGFMLGFNDNKLHAAELNMSLYALMPDTRSFHEYATYLRDTAQELIQKSSANGHKIIDVISDVIIPTCTRWVCHTICDVSLEVNDVETLNKQFRKFSTLYAFIFRKFDTADGWGAREDAIAASKELAELIEDRVEQAVNPPPSNGFIAYLRRLWNEFTFGHDLGKPSSRTFLERLSTTNDTVGKFGHVTRHEDFKKLLYPKDDPKKAKGNLRKLRLTANVLGLCVVLSVNYALVCSQAVGFYLHKERGKERKTIIDLIELKVPEHDDTVMTIIRDLQSKHQELYGSIGGDNDAHKITPALRDFLLMGYIREAQRIDQPFGLLRRALKDTKVGGLELKKDDLIFADFGSMHMDSDKFPEPGTIIPDRRIHSIQGLGVHKCPGLSLIDNTMTELFSMIFRLKNLQCTEGSLRGLVAFESRPENHKLKSMDPRLFLDIKGETTPYPTSLPGKFEKFQPPLKRVWDVPPSLWTWWKMLIDFFIVVLILLFILRMLPSRSIVTHTKEGTTREIICNSPTTVFQRWEINTIVPGLDGQPSPIEYTLEHRKPHRLSVIDIDERDMQLSVYVDGIIRGVTTDFELDKSVSCGEDVQVCLAKNFSGGIVVVPPGRHTVKIVWCGKEYLPGTEDIDWGHHYSRRLMWQLEYCA